MIPLYDSAPVRSRIYINWVLIVLNLMMFAVTSQQSAVERTLTFQFVGLTPANISLAQPSSLLALVTHTFLHANWLHFLGNMLMLMIFGDNIEDLMGSWRYLLFYLLGGIVAGAMQALTHIGSTIPSIGASGAIAAVFGAYLLYFPNSRLTIFNFKFIRLPSYIYMLFWIMYQIIYGVESLVNPNDPKVVGTAWWAHIGGFVFGILCGRYFAQGKKPPKTFWKEGKGDSYPWLQP